MPNNKDVVMETKQSVGRQWGVGAKVSVSVLVLVGAFLRF